MLILIKNTNKESVDAQADLGLHFLFTRAGIAICTKYDWKRPICNRNIYLSGATLIEIY